MIPILWEKSAPAFRARADLMIRRALESLRLTREVRGVVVAPREGRYGDDAWIRWTHERPLHIWLEPEVGAFLSPSGRGVAARAKARLTDLPARRFAPRSFAETLLHELSHVHDELLHGIRAHEVPPVKRQEFNEVWNVWIDGRLHRRGGPSLARRAWLSFFRHTFRPGRSLGSAAGRVFERLWNAERLSHEDLLQALQELEG